MAYGRGDTVLAARYWDQALATARGLDRPQLVGMCLSWPGMLAIDQGDYAEAIRAFRNVLAMSAESELGSLRIGTQFAAWGPVEQFIAVLALMTGHPQQTVRLLSNSRVSEDLGDERFFLLLPQRAIYERTVSQAQEVLGRAEFDRAWADGRTMSPDQVTADLEAVLNDAEAWQEHAPSAPPSPFGLTLRELDILRLLVDGRSNPQIAEALFISPRTVQTHLTNLYGKLGAGGRAEAVALAVRQNIA